MTRSTWTALRRTGLVLGLLALGEILAVHFLVPRLGGQLYGRMGLPHADEFLFVEDLAQVDFLRALPYELVALASTFGLAITVALVVGLLRRRTPLSYGLNTGPLGWRRLTQIGGLAGAFIWLLPNVPRILDHYVVDLGPGTAFWTLQEQVPWGLGYWLLMAASSFVLIPILEEFLVRGYVLGRLSESFRAGESILIVAFLFAFAHGQYLRPDVLSVGALLSIVVNSTLLGYLVFRTGSLWPSIVAHAIVNVPATFPWKLTILVACLVVLFLYRRSTLAFAREWGRFMKEHTRPGVLLVALVLPALMILAMSDRLPLAGGIWGVCIALGVGSLFTHSTWTGWTSSGADCAQAAVRDDADDRRHQSLGGEGEGAPQADELGGVQRPVG